MTDLARYLFMVSRMTWRATQARTATTIAPHFFAGGKFTGYPAALHPVWLARRGISHGHRAVAALVEAGVLRCDAAPDNPRSHPKRVYHLLPDSQWRWEDPIARAMAQSDWATLSDRRHAYGGSYSIMRELAPLLSGRYDVTVTPYDEQHAAFVAVGERLVARYGLDVLRTAVRGALEDPDAIFPFEAWVFERHFFALVLRGRRAEAA